MFKGLETDGGDDKAVEMEAVEGEMGKRDVSAMGWVEAAAEKRDSH